jgi:hypothetical protein
MQHRNPGLILLALLVAACSDVVEPNVERVDAASFAALQASQPMPASGTFSQTAITSLDVRAAGPNTFLQQTSVGLVSGTLSGTYEDDLNVVIHQNGRFNARFTITCQCTVDGQTGVLHLVANDIGELISPTVASFAGRAVITGGTGDLSALRGVLQIAGTVDLVTGLSTYTYSGTIR